MMTARLPKSESRVTMMTTKASRVESDDDREDPESMVMTEMIQEKAVVPRVESLAMTETRVDGEDGDESRVTMTVTRRRGSRVDGGEGNELRVTMTEGRASLVMIERSCPHTLDADRVNYWTWKSHHLHIAYPDTRACC
eukprot:2412246-Rhodomonas_salina.1